MNSRINSVLKRQGATRMDSVTIIGSIIALFVILNGIYVITYPPSGDELQGYALIAIGIFIILMSWQMGKCREISGE